MQGTNTRVLLADDHKVVLTGLRALLENEPGIEVVAEANNGRDAVRLALEHAPDVIVMDLSMPDLNGIEATRRVATQLPEAKVLCLSMHSERRFIAAAFQAGASGYLLKDCALEELGRAIREIAAGRAYLSPGAAGVVVDQYREAKPDRASSAFSVLSPREREVLQLIAEGEKTQEIADRLHVSTKTIGTHRERIMAKLNIRSVAGLTKYAIREGLTTA